MPQSEFTLAVAAINGKAHKFRDLVLTPRQRKERKTAEAAEFLMTLSCGEANRRSRSK